MARDERTVGTTVNVLCHGIPFCCDWTPLTRYRGAHDIRSIGNHPECHYRYDPNAETWPEIVARIAREWMPELALFWVPEIHPPPERVEDSPIRTVALVSDWNVHYPVLAANLMRYDLVLCDRPGVEVLAGPTLQPHHLFPLYSHIANVHRPHDVPKDIDVLFVGNLNHAAHPTRGRFLERLARLADRYRIVIATNYVGDAYAHLLSRARIVFNHSIRGELNLRVFETIACGSVPMLERANREALDWFTDGRDIVLYDEHDFVFRIESLLHDSSSLDAVRDAAHARTETFAGENRFDALIAWAASQRPAARGFHALEAAERSYQDVLQYGFSRWNVYYATQGARIGALARSLPDDPRVWTAIARHLLDLRTPTADAASRRQDAMKAFHHAWSLNPQSAPRALNCASACRMYQDTPLEEQYLLRVIHASAIDGAEELLGSPLDATYTRWHLAVACKTADVRTLHAEAWNRLAVIRAGRGELDAALDHLRSALHDDPASTKGGRLHAEIFVRLGRAAEGASRLEQTIAATPFDFENRARLIELLDQLERPEAAAGWRQDTDRIRRALV